MIAHRFPLLWLLPAILAGCTSVDNVPSLAITHVTVIDATGTPGQPGMTVIVNGSRIAAITPSTGARVPRNARVIDGSGKFMIPGLWDMHTHLSFYGPEALSMVVQNGVLFVRDLGGSLEELDRWRAEIDSGVRTGPNIFRAGPYIDGPKEFDSSENGKLRKATTITVTTPAEGRAAVDSLAGRVDTIKTHNALSKESFLAVAAECHRLNLPLAAHPPSRNITIEEVSDAGVTTLEHIEMLTESIVFASMQPDGKPKKDPVSALDEMTDEYSMNLFRRFARNGTAYDPTLVGYRTFMQEAVDLAPKDPRWVRAAAGRTKMFNRFVEMVGLMKRAGVQVVTGTDFGIRPETVKWPVPVPGSDLHEEMKLFVQGGLTPMEALQSATILPARILRVSDRLGTIEAGKEADLLLLDADPLVNIANTRTIRAVIFRGKVLALAGTQ
jgi:imidazolonepropionase-like amidohydrolase